MKKFVCVLLTVAVLLACVPVSAAESGNDGTAFSWSIEDGTLSIDGTGEMPVHGPDGDFADEPEAVVVYETACDSTSGATFASATDPLDSTNKVWSYTGGDKWSYKVDYNTVEVGVEYTVSFRYYLPTLPSGTTINVGYYFGDGYQKPVQLTATTSGWQELSYTFSTSVVGSVYRFMEISGATDGTVALYLDDITVSYLPTPIAATPATVDYETTCDSTSGTNFTLATDPLDSTNKVWSYTGGDKWSYKVDYNTVEVGVEYTVSFRYYLPTIPSGTTIKIGYYFGDGYQTPVRLTAATSGWQELSYTFSTSVVGSVYRFMEISGATDGTVALYLDDITVKHGGTEGTSGVTGVTATYVDYSNNCDSRAQFYFTCVKDPTDADNNVFKYSAYDQYDTDLLELIGAENGVEYTVSFRYNITDMGSASSIHLAYHMGGSMKSVKSFYGKTDGWQTISYPITYDGSGSAKRFIELYAKDASGGNTGDCDFYIDDIVISHTRTFTEDELAPWAAYEYSTVEIGEGVTSVGAYAFLADVSAIYLPQSLEVIRYGAFDPDGVTIYYNGTEAEWKQVFSEMDLSAATVVCLVDVYNTGDYNNDGETDVMDAILLRRALSEVDEFAGRAALTAVDMDVNNGMSETDMSLLRKYLITNGLLPTAPTAGGTVTLTNDLVAEALTDYTPGSIAPYSTGYDEYAMNTVYLRWLSTGSSGNYTVSVSTNSAMTDATVYTTADHQVGLVNLMPETTYYWTVSDGTETTAVASFTTDGVIIRTIDLPEGISNTRDLGGYTTNDGKTVKYGMIYRGANLDHICLDETKEAITAGLGVKTDLDLRGTTVSLTASPLGSDVNYLKYDCCAYTGGSRGLDKDDANRAGMVEVIRQLADESNYPIYMHCAVGRDRTGTVSMLINALLGVDETALYMDYEFSLLSVAGTEDQSSAASLLSSFTTMLDYLKGFSATGDLQEGVQNYLLSIGITQAELDSIRDIMLED